MTRELSAAEKAFNQAKRQFVVLSKRTAKALNSERERLGRQLKSANARGKKIRAQLDRKREALSKAVSASATATIKTQMKELRERLAAVREESKETRSELAAVRADLASARDHLGRALHVDKAMTVLEKQWAKVAQRKGKEKAAREKKAAAKKKPAAKKRATAKKKTGAGKKAAAKRKPAARKKAATKKKPTVEKPTAA
jgi:hypothetical protein